MLPWLKDFRAQVQIPWILTKERLLPIHHYHEHHQKFGPVIVHWTKLLEAKHWFFKKTVRQTGGFRNISLTCEQAPVHGCIPPPWIKSDLSGTETSKLSVDVLQNDIKWNTQWFYTNSPNTAIAHRTNKVCYFCTNYTSGMLVCYTSTAGLPGFAEMLQIILVSDKLTFVVHLQNMWYNEHLQSYELENTGNVQLVEKTELQ